MSRWRQLAIEKFPHLHRSIADAENAGWVWFELRRQLENAYRHDPLDENLVREIYEYASWCLHHRSIDIRTAVVLWFYEQLPANALVWSDMPRWMSQDDFDLLEFAWRYVLKDENVLKTFQREFAARKAVFQEQLLKNRAGKPKRD